jgi:hypothetical protein
MICHSCRRDVDYVRNSFWHGEARICRECFAQWCDPDSDLADSADVAGIGNYVRLRHGLPPLAAALVILLLAGAPPAQASRHCLDYAEAARTWPTRMLAKDADGCWTYDHHPPRAEVPNTVPQTILPRRESTLMDRWDDTELLQVELRELEGGNVSAPEPAQPSTFVDAVHLALFASLVLATVSVIEVATVRHGTGHRRARWPDRISR